MGLPDRHLIVPVLKALLVPACLTIGVLAALPFWSQWSTALKFFYPSAFQLSDPLFGNDISFYVFGLPFLRLLYRGIMASLTLGLLSAAAIYLFNRAIHILPRGVGTTRQARAHLLVGGALLLLAKAWGYRLEAYDLLFSPRGVAFGASYTDVHADLPVLKLLVVLSLACALLLLISVFRRGWKLPVTGFVALIAVSILGKGLFPGLLQRFSVAPNEIAMERPYIDLNIKYTRQAFGLNNIEEREFPADENLTWGTIQRNEATVQNIRLWDTKPLLTSYSQLQEIRTYYKFVDIDVDRYVINGRYRQVTLSPREISYKDLPSKIWINERLNYTHGYGIVMGPVNLVTAEGLPEFFIKDIPPRSLDSVEVRRPEIYFGEIPNDYVFVKTKAQEFDYPSGDRNVYSTYAGTGGVPLSSFWRKALFSMRLGSLKILLSNDLTPESRILLYRDIRQRASRIAPFLRYDSDPYVVVTGEGKLFWILDAYTVSSMYPYSEPVRGIGNYIRNSVKVVIDAYNGTVHYYVSDPQDPIVQTYARIFPDLFKPLDTMAADLKAHLRYPEGLFSVQAQVYATYHMQDSQVFYNKEDLWSLPVRGSDKGQPMEPYFTIMKLPGETKEEFILLVPFTPSRKDNMSAWLAARNDLPNYGKLIVYNFPKQKLIFGPRQIEARIDQDAEISQQISLWNQTGSQVIRGNLLAIPIETSLIYVQPLYLAAAQGQLPELKRVIVAYGNRIVMEENLERALTSLFRSGAAPRPVAPGPVAKRGVETQAQKAMEAYNRALQYLREGNWASYGQEVNRLGELLREMSRQSK
ncbi:MAG: UPF0182 family protein [Candidatus Tectomicrobia bacterium]|uniref:UPF0182 protein HYY65_05655 n=1 Tax=Tectimicrobiota bacterium TaxID=2528274 RepID=A0A932GPD5_UNCTE|nr:UPF0182 family protein [Candidatus Tectomicrobia bacterium]